MIQLVLDTGIYRKDPNRDGPAFDAIVNLASSGLLKLHIPYVVEREFQTNQRKVYEADLKKALSGLSGLSRKKLSKQTSEKITAILDDLKASSDDVLADAEGMLVSWAESINAKRIPLCIEQASSALEAYFQGLAPLKEVKIRDDIPDSFIARAIEKILPNVAELHFVVEDAKLRETFDVLETVHTYKNLNEFIASDLIQDELLEADLMEKFDQIKEVIASVEAESEQIKYTIAKDVGEAIVNSTINDSSIPDDNHEATINGYNDPEDIELNMEDISYFGNGSFGIPFTASMEVGAYYYLFKADYYAMDAKYGDKMPSVTDHNDHYYEAEDTFYVRIHGMVSIDVDKKTLMEAEEYSEIIASGIIELSDIADIEFIEELS